MKSHVMLSSMHNMHTCIHTWALVNHALHACTHMVAWCLSITHIQPTATFDHSDLLLAPRYRVPSRHCHVYSQSRRFPADSAKGHRGDCHAEAHLKHGPDDTNRGRAPTESHAQSIEHAGRHTGRGSAHLPGDPWLLRADSRPHGKIDDFDRFSLPSWNRCRGPAHRLESPASEHPYTFPLHDPCRLGHPQRRTSFVRFEVQYRLRSHEVHWPHPPHRGLIPGLGGHRGGLPLSARNDAAMVRYCQRVEGRFHGQEDGKGGRDPDGRFSGRPRRFAGEHHEQCIRGG